VAFRGDYDYVEQILASLGAYIHIRAVAVKPVNPLQLQRFLPQELLIINRCYTLACQEIRFLLCKFWFVQPALKKLSVFPWDLSLYRRDHVVMTSDGKRETYLWGQLHLVDGNYEFQLACGSHSSGNLINLAQTTGLAILPMGQTLISTGEQVQVLQVGSPLEISENLRCLTSRSSLLKIFKLRNMNLIAEGAGFGKSDSCQSSSCSG